MGKKTKQVLAEDLSTTFASASHVALPKKQGWDNKHKSFMAKKQTTYVEDGFLRTLRTTGQVAKRSRNTIKKSRYNTFSTNALTRLNPPQKKRASRLFSRNVSGY